MTTSSIAADRALDDLGCDQPWFHQLCDGAPYDGGGCESCGD